MAKHANTFASSSYCNNGYEWAIGAMWASSFGFAVLCLHDFWHVRKALLEETAGKGRPSSRKPPAPTPWGIWLVTKLESFSYSPRTIKRMGRMPATFAFIIIAISFVQVYLYTLHWNGGQSQDLTTLAFMWFGVLFCSTYFMLLWNRNRGREGAGEGYERGEDGIGRRGTTVGGLGGIDSDLEDDDLSFIKGKG